MEQFSLEKYLENPSRKITTRYGDREVRIICTDRKDKRPIVALMIDTDDGSEYITSHSINGWIDDEEKYPDKRDLFFADEKGGLTEFEKEVDAIIDKNIKRNIGLKYEARNLLNLARKELQPEFDKEMDKLLAETDKVVYQKGQQDALKDLPKWKKTKKDNPYDPCIIKYTDYTILETGGYGIRISELFEKLPKEE